MSHQGFSDRVVFFCRSSMCIFCSASEEEGTVSCLCFAKKVEETIIILKRVTNLEIIVIQITEICKNIANTNEKKVMIKIIPAITLDRFRNLTCLSICSSIYSI